MGDAFGRVSPAIASMTVVRIGYGAESALSSFTIDPAAAHGSPPQQQRQLGGEAGRYWVLVSTGVPAPLAIVDEPP